jgi:ATP-dependent protease ClpP protease subunit
MNHQELSVQMFELKTEVAFKYGFNISARVIQLVGEVCEEMFTQFDTALTILEEESKEPVTVKINSLGGSVYDGLAIVGRIRSSKCKVITEGFGSIMSCAILIMAAGSKRRMSRYAQAMWHEGSYESVGTVEQMLHTSKQMKNEENAMCAAMEEFTGTPAKFWLTKGKLGKDLFLVAERCQELGIIDEII